MKNKGRINHSVQEGIFFLLVGAALLGYAVTSYGKAFNKDWNQSPYLFPLMVAAAFYVSGGLPDQGRSGGMEEDSRR